MQHRRLYQSVGRGGTLKPRVDSVPYGECHCGCGGKTTIATKTRADRGHIKGEPKSFIRGHSGSAGYSVPLGLVEHFNRYVTPLGRDVCWEWSGSRATFGHGQFQNNNVLYSAHRVAYELGNGPIPAGMAVRHKCDNPPCCNPSHLEVGTQSDNVQDAVERNRVRHGESHPCAVLTEEGVREIRKRRSEGETNNVLAREFGVHPATISAVVHYRTWRRVA